MKARVLVVEEGDGLRDAVAEALELAGYEVMAASLPQIALEILQSHRNLNGILADPVFEGNQPAQFLQELLTLSRSRGLPLLVCTAEPEINKMALEIGVAACLPKPFELDQLLKILSASFL